MKRKMKTVPGMVAVVLALVVAAGVVAQVYPVKWEEETAPAEEAGLDTPQPLVTINGFYTRTRAIDCTMSASNCEVGDLTSETGGLFTTKCDTGDVAVGGSAYRQLVAVGADTYSDEPSRPWGAPDPKGWQGLAKLVTNGQSYFVKVVCADVG